MLYPTGTADSYIYPTLASNIDNNVRFTLQEEKDYSINLLDLTIQNEITAYTCKFPEHQLARL